MYSAEVLLDSVNPNGDRLTTMRVTMPRIILAEFNTHRVFSRNAASSRAISVKRRIQMVRDNPFVPESFGKNQPGMQASELLTDADAVFAEATWRAAATAACEYAEDLNTFGVHKQLANRLLEPFTWVTVIVSATEWNNFFALRISPLAQPEIEKTARLMKEAMGQSVPKLLQWGSWHIPLADEKEVAVGRLARVSYEANPKSDQEERDLCTQLAQAGHWSPFEHVAQAKFTNHASSSRNFCNGWIQWRAMID